MLRSLRSLWAASVLLFLGLPLQADTVFVKAPSVAVTVSPVVVSPYAAAPNLSGRLIQQPAIANQFGRTWERSESGLLVPGRVQLLEKSRLDGLFENTGAESESTPVVPPAQTGLSGRALLNEVNGQAAKGQTTHDYGKARRAMFSMVDNIVLNGVRGVIDSYSGIFVAGKHDDGNDYPERGDENHDGRYDKKGMNAEHIWPQSFFDSRSPMRSDLHHLLPTFISVNEIRGHLPFGEIKGRPEYSNSGGAKMGNGEFEPPDFMKGRVARAVFYFYTRYNAQGITGGAFAHNFWNGKLEMFLRWNREHPVTQDEIERNNRVQSFQGNRNPFVDDPTLADRIGVEGFTHQGGRTRGGGFRPAESRSSGHYHGRNNRHKHRRHR